MSNLFPIFIQGVPNTDHGSLLHQLTMQNADLAVAASNLQQKVDAAAQEELELLRACFKAARNNTSLIWDEPWMEARKKYEEKFGGTDEQHK